MEKLNPSAEDIRNLVITTKPTKPHGRPETLDDHVAVALGQVALDNPLSFLLALYDLDAVSDDEPLPDSALALLNAALPLAFAKLVKSKGKLPYRWQPCYLAPLANGTWLALNGNCTPLGYDDIRPYVPAQFPNHSWEFPPGFDPRSLRGVWRPRSPCGCGHPNGWAGMWLEFSVRNYGANIGKVVAATKDPLRCAEMLLPPWHDPPPPLDAPASALTA
jgi:hypothetical protein